MRILLIEDHPKMAEGVARGLRQSGYTIDVCGTGCEGEERAVGGEYDAVILDLVLPDRDGIEVCRNIRSRSVTIPILMLTALSSEGDRIAGLNAGADDFLAKPFEFEQLLASLRALLRRAARNEEGALRCEDLVLDPSTGSVTRGEAAIRLNEGEYALLEYLMRNEDRVLSPERIASDVWGMPPQPGSNAVAAYVSGVRKKIDRGADRPLIHDVQGGYRFGAPD